MIFTISLYASLTVFVVGSLFRIGSWFRLRIGPDAAQQSMGTRIGSACGGFASTLLSRRILSFLKVFSLDVLLQARILKDDFLRWLIHILVFYGFILLLLMHALEKQVTQVLFRDYASTLNPYLFLRNLFGAMVLSGLLLAVYRRIRFKGKGVFTNRADGFAIVVLLAVVITGFLLEGVKILSAPIFHEMVDEYAPMADPEEVRELEIYWARDFGVVFPDLSPTERGNTTLARQGRMVHEDSCSDCHARPSAAFVSYPLAKLLSPIGAVLNDLRSDRWLLILHFLVCFLGLAYLPFSKLFHVISSPASLLSNLVGDPLLSNQGNRAWKRALALDACTHCGACSEHCSVRPVFRQMLNANILPSEKLVATQALAKGPKPGHRFIQELSEGSFLCTSCYRCTEVCPVGINLQDLWMAAREDLTVLGYPEPHVWVKEMGTAAWAARLKDPSPTLTTKGGYIRRHLNLCDRRETFYACVQCQTCTHVCPVVACAEDPKDDLEVTPQQVMNLLRLGLKDLALGSRMVWDCTTCYMCQEHCPEGIPVADILYELRNLAYEQFRAIRVGDQDQDTNVRDKKEMEAEDRLS